MMCLRFLTFELKQCLHRIKISKFFTTVSPVTPVQGSGKNLDFKKKVFRFFGFLCF